MSKYRKVLHVRDVFLTRNKKTRAVSLDFLKNISFTFFYFRLISIFAKQKKIICCLIKEKKK